MGQQPDQECQNRPISQDEFGPTHLTMQYPEHMAQDRDLHLVLKPRTPPTARDIDQPTNQ
jgi:hypothetical protein